MRNPERLNDFYEKMKELHKKYVPDWRWGQLVYNFICEHGDPFYWEEEETLERLEEYLKEVTGK